MNRENLLRTAEAIERGRPNVTFNMWDWGTQKDCGTVACIAGWTCLIFDGSIPDISSVRERAAEILGLTSSESSELFIWGWGDYDINVTPQQAATRLRELAESCKTS